MADDLEGKIQIQSDLVPDNGNPRQPVTSVEYVKGGPQTFTVLDDLIAFHPLKMRRGMSCKVVNIDLVSSRVFVDEYTLMVEPDVLLDANKNSIVTLSNYLKYWTRSNQTQTQSDRVFQYSPDGPNGTRPPYPYADTPSFETNWHAVASPTDRWVRWRDNDDFITVSSVKVYTGWTLPVSIGQQNVAGDFVDNLYLRQDVNTAVRNSTTGLINGLYYLVLTGIVTESASGEPDVDYSDGRVFKFVSANGYVFASATVRETVPAPPRVINGIPNNEPDGWSDVPPGGNEQLWGISAAKSVYGDLKSEWQIRKIDENPDLIRFSESASPNPNTLVGTNDSAATGSQGDTDLNNAGWLSVYQTDFKFTAERSLTGGSPSHTEWEIRKISGESGEYQDRVFKLFDINADFDDIASNKPVTSDAIAEGFSDVPLLETDTQINYVFESRKFFDGTLKGSWSNGTPYSAKDVFNDIISSSGGDNFKYNPNSVTPNDPFPATLTLTADLYRGLSRVSENSEVTYVWTRIYNNGAGDSTVISSFTNTDPLYLLAASGTFGNPGYMRSGQRLVVTPAGVTGKAIFQCSQTLVIPNGANILFTELFTINDVTDGLDAKDLSVKADVQLIIYDNSNDVFAPTKTNLNAFFSNLVDPVIYWFKWNGSAWVVLASSSPYIITVTPFGSQLNINNGVLFDHDDLLQEFRYAASTHPTNPNLADSTITFSDFVTIAKAAAAAVGTPGKNSTLGLLSNEYQNITLDDETGVPFSGEIGASGRAQTILSVFDGVTQIAYGGGANKFTIALSSDNGSVTFASNTSGLTNDVRVYVNTWTAQQRKATCTITITYNYGSGTLLFIKKFTVGSVLDTPGSLTVIIDSDGGFEFLPLERGTPKTLTAKVYDSSKTPQLQIASDFYFNWTVGGSTDVSYVRGASGTNGEIKTVSRAQVLVSAFITVRIAKIASPTTNDIIRSTAVRINDITDGKTYRLFSAAISAPTKPASNVGPGGNGTWFPYLLTPLWAVDGSENPNTNPVTYTWSDPYQVGGEKGDQGFSGGTYISLYRSSGSDPNTAPGFGGGGNLGSIAQMYTAGWRSSTPGQLPTSGYIWETKRLYKTINSGGTELTFDGNGYPVNEVIYSSSSVWLAPQRLTPIPGNPGTNGSTGPGYNGVTFIGTDGSGNYIYSLNPVNGAAAANLTIPKGATGSNGLLDFQVIFKNTAVIGNSVSNIGGSNIRNYSSRTWTNNKGRTVIVKMEGTILCETNGGQQVTIRLKIFRDFVLQDWEDQPIQGEGIVPLKVTYFATVYSGDTVQWNFQAEYRSGSAPGYVSDQERQLITIAG